MTSIVDFANECLLAIGARATVSSLQDQSPQAQACNIIIGPKLQMLLRSAHWGCARRALRITELKARYINGTLSTDPPPEPFLYEYLYPPDCLKARFIPRYWNNDGGASTVPLTTGGGMFPAGPRIVGFMPFAVGLDTDSANNPLKVILTNQCRAQLVYTQDISQTPDLWDSQFHQAAVATCGAFLVNPLARNAALMNEMSGLAANLVAQARATDGNEALPSQDHIPDWVQIRASGGGYGDGALGGFGFDNCAGWDALSLPGLTY